MFMMANAFALYDRQEPLPQPNVADLIATVSAD